jgi:hypothetical protein
LSSRCKYKQIFITENHFAIIKSSDELFILRTTIIRNETHALVEKKEQLAKIKIELLIVVKILIFAQNPLNNGNIINPPYCPRSLGFAIRVAVHFHYICQNSHPSHLLKPQILNFISTIDSCYIATGRERAYI